MRVKYTHQDGIVELDLVGPIKRDSGIFYDAKVVSTDYPEDSTAPDIYYEGRTFSVKKHVVEEQEDYQVVEHEDELCSS